MTKAAVIAGQVLGPSGDPARDRAVLAWPAFANSPGRRTSTVFGPASVDERGTYRLHGLPPGRYLVAVVYSEAANGNTVAVPLFYPGVSEPLKAAAVTVRRGEERHGVDFTMPATTQAFVIAGAVLGSGGDSARAVVCLYSKGFDRAPATSAETTDKAGRFRFEGVPPGSYDLVALTHVSGRRAGGFVLGPTTKIGRQSVAIVHADVDVMLEPRDAPPIEGQAGFDAPVDDKSCAARLAITLDPVEPLPAGFVMTVNAGPAGHFKFPAVPPGEYRVRVSGLEMPCSVHSLSIQAAPDGKVVLENEVVYLGRERLYVTLTTSTASLTGTVVSDASPCSGAALFMVPFAKLNEPASWGNHMARSESNCTYRIKVPPGSYRVIAFPPSNSPVYADPAFWEDALSTAPAIVLLKGQEQRREISISEDRLK